MNLDDLGWGGWMTLAGMGTVFGLLALLMGVLMLIGVLDRRTVASQARRALPAQEVAEPAEPDGEPSPGEVAVAPGLQVLHDGLTAEQVAAVALAVTVHARVRRAQAAPAMRSHQPGSHLYASRWVSVGRGQQNTSWRRN